MYPSKLGTTVAILAATAGFSALVDSAHAQISGTIGGDVVDNGACQVLGDRSIALTDGNMAFQWGRQSSNANALGCLLRSPGRAWIAPWFRE
ncbi:hypothetical protein OM076_00535 [Solirubrobacter ginsenosidimutans]|uniref:Uncharacterized protein n=1 Tax=Solirubrobacter ginsenosidimutans TaxID=490573 RepID=A0A9X3MP89_9ACTN|nr:hypothetical protein [Solirubrobacter ginsenosidimutans]MDA0158733.1 hypothetical protein [Solirubrobacter ginsenosidimutans]